MSIRNLSLAAPAYNEAEGIRGVIESWERYLRSLHLDSFEIVVCDDGSTDDTLVILTGLRESIPEIKVVNHPINRGAAAALASAIRATTKDWVLLIDSDGQFPVEAFKQFAEAQAQTDAVALIGRRRKKENRAFSQFGSWASGAVCNAIYGTHYADFNSAFKLVSGDTLRGLHLEARGLNYSTEITAKLAEINVPLVEVEVVHLPRQSGNSSLKALRGALHRLSFVAYLGVRRLLLKMEVIQLSSEKGAQ